MEERDQDLARGRILTQVHSCPTAAKVRVYRPNRSSYWRHLEECARIVATWPAWKRGEIKSR